MSPTTSKCCLLRCSQQYSWSLHPTTTITTTRTRKRTIARTTGATNNNKSEPNLDDNYCRGYCCCCWINIVCGRLCGRFVSSSSSSSLFPLLSSSLLLCLLLLSSNIPYSLAENPIQQQSQQPLRAPKIKEHPTSLVVKKNDPATLECKADGNPPPTIEWYKDNQKIIPDPSAQRMVLGDQLFFLTVKAKKGENSDIGTYYCVAKNAVGKAKSRNATLEVALLKDEFRVMPVNTKVALGKSITMECVPPKGRPEPEVMWKHNGKLIQIDRERYKKDGTNLIITDVMKHDEGQYQCIAKNMIGVRESPAANLEVLVEPYFIRPPESIKTMADSDVVFHCQVGGDPQPKISWRKIEGELPIGKSQILEEKALRIRQVKTSDQGTYVCEAENPAGKISKSATLIVNSRPTLLISPKNVQAMVNDIAQMECLGTGNPEPIYFWHKENAHLLMLPGQAYGKYNVSNDGVLSIMNVAKEDQGFYVCSVVSEVGSTMARAYLRVLSKEEIPPPIIRLGPTNQTLPWNTTAFLPCEAFAPDSSNITIQWFYNQIPIYNDSHFIITPHALQIHHIQPTDSGTYTCLATSASGSTSWNAALRVESPYLPYIKFSKMPHPSMFPESPSKPAKVNVTATTVTLKWQRSASSANSAIAPHVGSQIEAYSPDLKYGWTVVAKHIPVDIYTVNMLQPNTRYVFYVRAQNIHGLGFPSDISDEIKTLDVDSGITSTGTTSTASDETTTTAMVQARNILNNVNVKLRDARAITSTSIKVMWNVVGNMDFIEGYYIRFQNLKIYQQHQHQPPKFNLATVRGSTATVYTLEDLNKYAPYRLFIMPFYKTIVGKPSNMVIERTLEDVPSAPPYSITSRAMNASCAVIEWLPPLEEHQNGIILGYYLLIYENNTSLYLNLSLSASHNSIVLDNLTLGSKFSIRMSAYTAIGNGPLSEPIYLTMDLGIYDGDDEYNHPGIRSKNQPSFFSNVFWVYLFLILMTIVMFIIAVRLVLIYAQRKNNKSIYEKASSSLNENFSDNNCPKYDSNSSKYSSCPDNNEYAEVSDLKLYGEPNAEPYAMTPLIGGKSIIGHQSTNANHKLFFNKSINLNDHPNDSGAKETLLNHGNNNNHHGVPIQREMIHMDLAEATGMANNNLPIRPAGTYQNQQQQRKYKPAYGQPSGGGFNIFANSPDNTSGVSSLMAGSSYEDENNQLFDSKNMMIAKEIHHQPQHSLPSGRPTFNYMMERNDPESSVLNSFRAGRDGRNLMTFHQSSAANNKNINCNIGGQGQPPPTTRIISNPLSAAYESNSGSESGGSSNNNSNNNNNNNNKNYLINHYYASSEINKLPFINDSSSTSSLSNNGSNGKLGSLGSSSCYSNCDNNNTNVNTVNDITTTPILGQNSDNRRHNHNHNHNHNNHNHHNHNDSIHNQMVKNRIHKKRKRSANSSNMFE